MKYGIYSIVTCTIIAASVFYVFRSGEQQDASSKAFAVSTVSSLLKSGDESTFFQNVSDFFKSNTSERDFAEAYKNAIAGLGVFVSIVDIQGQSYRAMHNFSMRKYAKYILIAKFQTRTVKMHIILSGSSGKWLVDAMHFEF
jgi:hypothetical protein